MPLKTVKRRECKLVGDTVTHTPTGKWFSAYPEMPAIYLENMVDVGDYSDCELRAHLGRVEFEDSQFCADEGV